MRSRPPRPLFGPQESLWTEGQELFVLPWIEWDAGELRPTGVVFVMKPRSQGQVALNGPDPESPLRIEHGFLTDGRDREALVEGVELVRSLVRSGRLRRRGAAGGADADVGSYVDAEDHGFFHPVGTCGIGRVVEPDGKVIGIDGVYVCDASVMPTVPRANTHISTLAVAERIAELL